MKPVQRSRLFAFVAAVVVTVPVASVGGCQPARFEPSSASVQLDADALRVGLIGPEPLDGCSGPHSIVANDATFVGEVDFYVGASIFAGRRCVADIAVPLPLAGIDAEVSAADDDPPWSFVFDDVNIDRAVRVSASVFERGARYELLQSRPEELEAFTLDMFGDVGGLSIDVERTDTGASFVVPAEAASDNRLTIDVAGAIDLQCEGIECSAGTYHRRLEQPVTVID